jgi:hypothetical protein
MSTHSLRNPLVQRPAAAAAVPREAAWRRIARALWSDCQATGHAHAQEQLLMLAKRFEGCDPEFARQLRLVSRQQAAAVAIDSRRS